MIFTRLPAPTVLPTRAVAFVLHVPLVMQNPEAAVTGALLMLACGGDVPPGFVQVALTLFVTL